MTVEEPPIRRADPADRVPVLRVLEGALLDVDPGAIRAAIAEDRVLVADDPIAGALAVDSIDDGAHITAIAVRPSRRRTGIGTALVTAAADRWGRLSATFDDRAYPFYDALGFASESQDGRWVGHLD
ncbi:MAG: GNAT family N-acetyltransferase [Halobacteriaceae archaeon]